MTKVIFRRFPVEDGGDVIAIFPELAGDCNPYQTCLCFQHCGEHGAISMDYAKFTYPTDINHYWELFAELESRGYELEVVTRTSRKMLQERIAQCDFDTRVKEEDNNWHCPKCGGDCSAITCPADREE